MRINEPVGVVAIISPDEYPLLSFVSLLAPAVVRANCVVIIPSEKYPLPALSLYQVSSDMRGWFASSKGHYSWNIVKLMHTGCSKKTDTHFYFWDNFGNSAPILTILSLLQAEIYGA